MEGGWAAFTYFPIFLPVASPNETWGCSQSAAECPPGLCYRPAKEKASPQKLWGLALSMIDMVPLRSGTDLRLMRLKQQGYRYELVKVQNATSGAIELAKSSPPPAEPVSLVSPCVKQSCPSICN